MTPPKRPPPPSPLRNTAVSRPVAPSAGGKPAQPAVAENAPAKQSGSRPLLVWGSVAVGFFAALFITLGLAFFWNRNPPAVAVTTPGNETPVVVETPPAEPILPTEVPAESNPALPVEPLITEPPTTSTAPSQLPVESTSPPNPAPATTAPATLQPTQTTPAVAPAVQPAGAFPSASGAALDDVRGRNGVLPLPEKKLTEPVLLASLAVPSPQQCELTLLGSELVAPPGFSLLLKREDPVPEERVWHVALKSAGSFSKEKVIADFRLRAGELSFQWQKSTTGAVPALSYCLLQIDASGEKETCRLGKPLTSELLPLKIADRWTIEAALPTDLPSSIKLQAELQAVDFPNVTNPSSTTLTPGASAVYKVSGTSSGAHPVELELEVKLETKEGKLQLVVTPYVEPPAIGKAERRPVRATISSAVIKRRKAELAKQATGLDNKIKQYDTQIKALEREVVTVNMTPTLNASQRNAVSQRLTELRGLIAQGELEKDGLTTQQESFTDAAAWFGDLGALIDELQSQAKVGIVLFHTVGQERVIVAQPQSQP